MLIGAWLLSFRSICSSDLILTAKIRAEVLILAIPTYSGPVALAPHLFTIYAWILLRELDSVITHSGYEFGWQRFVERIVPFYGGLFFFFFLVC
jgi:hypothetical protein